MLDTAAARAARQEIVTASVAGLDQPAFLRRVASSLQDAVPCDAIGLTVTDPETLLSTGGLAVNMPDEAMLRYYDNELLQPDVNKFTELLQSKRAAGLLSVATAGDPQRSQRYRTMLAPFGHENELRFVATADGACWSAGCLVRDGARDDFTDAEVAFVTSLGRHVAHGLRSAPAPAAQQQTQVSDAPGMIVLDDDLRIVSATPEARAWLELLNGRWHGTYDGLPTVVRTVAVRARACVRGGAVAPPRARFRSPAGGWVVVHASMLTGGPSRQWAVVIEQARPGEVVPLIAQAHDLTPREQEVFGMLLRGTPDKEIARRLVVSDHTARDHTRRVLAKLGAKSRAELAWQVFAEHCDPWFAALN